MSPSESRSITRGMAVVALAWVLVAVGAVWWGLDRQQQDLEKRAAVALESAGIGGAVEFSGRDAELEVAAADREQAGEIVASLRGVRDVRFGTPLAGTDDPPPPTTTPPVTTTTPAPPTTGAPTTVPSTTVPPTTTLPPATTSSPTTTTSSSTTTTTTPSPPVARVVALVQSGALTVTGAIPSEAVAAEVAATADRIYAPFADVELDVDPDLPAPSWLAGLPGAITVLPILGTARLEIVGDTATLAGEAPTNEKGAQLAAALQSALGAGVTIDNEIEITGKASPSFTAEFGSDGRLLLSGVLPDATTAAAITAAAADVYGADRVVDDMTVEAGVDSTFSLARVPVLLPSFASIPQWQLQIDGDTISISLRGGATYASGKANLTPPLTAFLDIAEGILRRNPAMRLTIEGHTDASGPPDFNQWLSELRATTAATYLIEKGINGERLTAIGYGENRPIAGNDTDAGMATNRRLELILEPSTGGGG